MITVQNICEAIEEFAPVYNAESWDNVGLLAGRRTACVKKVLTCLDADTGVAQQAIEYGADMVVCHHPLVFNPLKTVTDDDEVGRTVLMLAQHGIALYAAHTNLDATSGGLCDDMAQRLGLPVVSELTEPQKGAEHACGRVLSADMTLESLCDRVKAAYNLPYVRCAGDKDKYIKTVAVCSGGGRGLIDDVIARHIDCYIAGDLHHADARRLVFAGSSFVEIMHFDSEISAGAIFARVLNDKFGDEISVKIAAESNPFQNF